MMRVSAKRTFALGKRGVLNYFLKNPLCVSFEVTHSCNAKCKHCHLGGPVEEQRASAERYAEIYQEIKPVVAQMSGGEPLLRNDLEQIIKAMKQPNGTPYIVITTNAALLTPERYRSLLEAGTDEFSISLDYPDTRHDDFRGIPGLFDRIEKLITSLPSGTGRAITLCCVIQSDNFRDCIQMAELAREWGVKLNFSTYTFLRTNNKSYMLSAEEIEEFETIVERLIEFRKKYGVIYTSGFVLKKIIEFFRNQQMPRCRTGTRFFNVNPDGTLSPCGLIIQNHRSQRELRHNFANRNSCVYCYTSIRANSEKPARHLIKDSFESL